ncbi:UDP-glucuronate 4-epimerase 2 [Triticum urartu]|uniref:UDP-glucuronate 4-epimerase 2 n=1 Tax=Triticum urartu TaxID=4572 RepID=M7YF11_TRIUA|nr:UDP-glucuronate 4-epimerase 2 [Triticum urartu]
MSSQWAQDLAPLPRLFTDEDHRVHRRRQCRLAIADMDVEAMVVWRERFPQDIVDERQFYKQRRPIQCVTDQRARFPNNQDEANSRLLLLAKLFDVAPFTHVLHLAAQAGVRHALVDPMSYVRANVAGLVALLEAARAADPQPAIVWASSSSVYGLNSHVPFSEHDRTDRPASLYAATKKAGEEIAHVYNHIYGLSLTALRFFTVYGPWGRPDMAYFFFTRDILAGRPITVYESSGGGTHQTTISRDFTYIDDIVKGCIGALDTAGRSTGSGGKKRGPAPFRTYNLGNTSPVPVTQLVDLLEKMLKREY